MKVLFLALYPASSASSRYRVHQFLPGLRAAGVDCTLRCAMPDKGRGPWRPAMVAQVIEACRRGRQMRDLEQFDRVFVQKSLTAAPFPGMLGLLEADWQRVVFDLDDAVHRQPPDTLSRFIKPFAPEGEPQAATLMRHARLTLAGNHWLEAETGRLGGRPRYFPTVVDTERFTPAPPPDTRYRLGWMGSPSTAPYLYPLAPVLQRVETPALLVGAGAVPLAFPAERVDWALDSEVAQLQRMSVGLMPQPGNEWGRGKCGLKALQYMACGKPVIASRFGVALELIEDGETGLLADSPDEWMAAIERLRDPAERARMGEAARKKVVRDFSLAVWTPRLLEALETLS
ncbi:MAG: hypothetical protein RLZZ303_594 [Candidatus Hydrogenedentota bacterium]|jgi:hypothetical protein